MAQDTSQNPEEEPKRTVRAERRRPSGPEGSGPPERAEAPQRQQDDADDRQTAPRPAQPSAGPQPASTGGRSNPLMMIIGVVIVLVFALFGGRSLLSPGGQDAGSGDSVQEPPPAQDQPADSSADAPAAPADASGAVAAPTRAPAAQPAAGDNGQTWLIMLYQDADDKVLEQDIYVDLNEAERVGSSDRVHIVAQVDRYRGGFQGDGDWSDVKRFYVTQDDDLQRVRSQVVEEVGEVNMADARTLADFVQWAVASYPADKYVLILADHGMGWPGGWSDTDSRTAGDRSIPLAAALGDQLFLMEFDDVLAEIRAQTGMEQFELIGMDACLMSHLEVYTALAPHARYAVASQETEPALGWAYASFLQALVENPGVSGAELGQYIVASYVQEDQRIVDDEARAELTRQNSGMSGLFGLFQPPSAEQVASQLGRDITLSAIDLAAIPAVNASLNDLVLALQEVRQQSVAKARSYAQSFTSVFGKQIPASYIDLGNFAQLLQREVDSPQITDAANSMLAAIDQAVLAEKHGPDKPGSTGISVYFPTSQLFNTREAGPPSYMAVARRFVTETLWDDYLFFHYTGRAFDASAVSSQAPAVPQRSEAVNVPGAGQPEISPLRLSATTAAPGRPILISADISGENIGYIYIFAGYLDASANSIFMADMDYLESPETSEVQGVFYPDWGEGDFTLEFEWEPLMFSVTDGETSSLALLQPERYGASPEEAVYSVGGLYTYADGEQRQARLYFSNGVLRQVFSFTGDDGTGAPREIVPEPGDQVTILEQWMDLDANGAVVDRPVQEGDTLTFGDQTFTWRELDAAAGPYIVGLIVEDLDGNRYAAYSQVTVE